MSIASEENLFQYFAKTSSYTLNEDVNHPTANLYMGDHTLYLKSDVDEQLIIHVAFHQTVSLKRLQLGLLPEESCPETIKLFVNQNNLGFSDAPDTPPTQVLKITQPDSPTVVEFKLNAAKWQRVDSITFFIDANHGIDYSTLYALKIFGNTIHSTNVADIHNTNQQHSHA